jgi:aspartate racemase
MIKTLGILGGMGPLASSEFLNSIYAYSELRKDQDAPACIMISEPSIPDRTEAIIQNNLYPVIQALTTHLTRLSSLGADDLLVTCFSSHYFFKYLDGDLRSKIISLIDILIDQIHASSGVCLLLATQGVFQTGIIQKHPRWESISRKVVVPDDADKIRIHAFIYDVLKQNHWDKDPSFFKGLASKYNVQFFAAGCTEFHIVNRSYLNSGFSNEFAFIDPLDWAARSIPLLLKQQRSFSGQINI